MPAKVERSSRKSTVRQKDDLHVKINDGPSVAQPPAPGKPKPMFDTPECEWNPASGANGTVTLDVGPWEGDPGIKPIHPGTRVSGVGDEAYDAGNTGLNVRKGSQGLRIWVFNVQSLSSRLDLEKQLAVVVVAKL